MKYHTTKSGYLIEKDDGTFTKHPYLYTDVEGNTIVRVTYDAAGAAIKTEVLPPKCQMTVDSATGEIKSVNHGFNLNYEITGECHCPEGCEIVHLTACKHCDGCGADHAISMAEVLPADFVAEVDVATIDAETGAIVKTEKVRKIAYKWDGVSKKMVKL